MTSVAKSCMASLAEHSSYVWTVLRQQDLQVLAGQILDQAVVLGDDRVGQVALVCWSARILSSTVSRAMSR